MSFQRSYNSLRIMKLQGSQSIISDHDLPAGGFSDWLNHIRQAQHTGSGVDVPCGDCAACCASSYFIHIRPDETDALARIPKPLLFPAPGLRKGHVVMGYGEQGCCPMFREQRCSIYEARPYTCRNYDCRVFAATGLPVGVDKPALAQQVRRWKFDFPTMRDRVEYAAVQTAAAFVHQHAESFPTGFVPGPTTQQAMLAIKVYTVFLNMTDESGVIVQAVMDAYKQFENRTGQHPC